MHNSAKRMADCAMTAAVSVVLMVLGAFLELGIYIAPILVGLCFVPVGNLHGWRWQLALYVVTGILCLLFVPNIEQNLLYITLFGWYPALHPALQKLPVIFRWLCKLVLFNGAIVGAEWLVLKVLAPEVIAPIFLAVLLLLGNITFVVYDSLIPRVDMLLQRIFRKK